MSANAALKDQTYTVDAADPVTVAGMAILRAQKMGVLAKAFGRQEVARHKIAEKLKLLGHQCDIDAMYLEALERYVEEYGNVPNASKVIASAQILDRLPDPQFESGHRVVFAINEDGTDFIGASEMGLAISPSGTTTTSRAGKVDERFGAITKKTLWIMIDFPEKTELDAIEVEQGQALAAVAEAIADPATAVENLDAIIAQVQELGEITDMSPTDVAATIETIANAIEAHNTATEAMTLVETGAASPDSPAVQKMNEKVEALSQQVAEQLSSQDSALPPVIAETIQAVMETAQPPQVAAADMAASAPEAMQMQAGAQPPVATTAEVMAEAPQTSIPESAAITADNGVPITQPQEQTLSQPAQAAASDQPIIAAETATVAQAQQVMAADTSATTQPQQTTPAAIQTPSVADVVAQTMPSPKNDAAIITPQAFERVQPAAMAAQVIAIAAQLPAAQNTAQAQTALKQVATAIKNDHHVPAVLQKKVEAVIAKMPNGPAKQELARVVEVVKAKQDASKPAPTAAPVAAPIIRQAFVGAPDPAHAPTTPTTAPRPITRPRNDNVAPNPTRGPDRITTVVTGAPTVAPTGHGPTEPNPAGGPREMVTPQPEGYKPAPNPDPIVPTTPGFSDKTQFKTDVIIPTQDKVHIDTQPHTFEEAVKTKCDACPSASTCFGKACKAAPMDAKVIAKEQEDLRAEMRMAPR